MLLPTCPEVAYELAHLARFSATHLTTTCWAQRTMFWKGTVNPMLQRKNSTRILETDRAAVGALAIGAVACGAAAIGALAVGAVAIGRFRILEARIEKLSVGTLTVDRLDVRSR